MRKKERCYTCLKRNHGWKSCLQNKGKDKPSPHSILEEQECGDKRNEKSSASRDTKEGDSDGNYAKYNRTNTVMAHAVEDSEVHFRVVPITIWGNKKSMETFALLDDCAAVSLVDERLIKELGLSINAEDVPLALEWTRGHTAEYNVKIVNFRVSGRNEKKQFKVSNDQIFN